MKTITYQGKDIAEGPDNCFRMKYGTEPSFGRFRMSSTDVGNLSNSDGDLIFGEDGVAEVTIKHIYWVKSLSLGKSDLNIVDICDIILADERITWQYIYGTEDWNTYQSSRRILDGGTPQDFEWENTDSGTPWTWTEILTSIATDLSVTIDVSEITDRTGRAYAKPRNIRGLNVPLNKVLDQVLYQMGAYLVFDYSNATSTYILYPIGYTEVANDDDLLVNNADGSPPGYVDYIHQSRVITINPLVAKSASASLRVASNPMRDSGALLKDYGSATSIGGTGEYQIPGPYAIAFLSDNTKENATLLGNIGNELTAEYKLSFANTWRDIIFSNTLPFTMNSAVHEIWWTSNAQGAFTRVLSYRPRGLYVPKDTLYQYDKYPIGGSESRRAFVKTTPGATTSVDVYLDNDASSIEVTVSCYIYGGGNLEDAFPTLTDGMPLWIQNDAGTWRNVTSIYKIGVNCNG